jgi:saccharopine dehydrogenase (NADP+, L-glutamate forming)
MKDNNQKKVPYKNIFEDITSVNVPGLGEFEGYPNRDSLKYIDLYGLRNAKTMLRGTLRSKGFCSAWNVFVQLGCCEEHYEMNVESMTHYDFFNTFFNTNTDESWETTLKEKIPLNANDLCCLRWSGFFDTELVGMQKGTPAQILEHILMKKWKLNIADKDMIVMWHRLGFEHDGKQSEIQSYLVINGEDNKNTAMAKTVGLPIGIVTKLLLEDKIQQRGVCIPIGKEFYEPVLKELKTLGISFKEQLS